MIPQPYQLPHACETAEIAAALNALSPRQRRVLRAYVWQVELGEMTVSEWLRAENCPVAARSWYRSGDGAQYLHNALFQTALAAYLRAGQKWQLGQEQRQIERARSALVRATPAAAGRIIEQAESDISGLFKISERWTEWPLPSQEIVGEKPGVDEDGKPIKLFLVRCVVLDLDRMQDPRYARLIKKFSDSPRNGPSIELYDAQKAAEGILDRADFDTANKAQSGTGVVVVLPTNEREDRDPDPGGTAD